VNEEGDGFLARWSRRKARVREGQELPPEQPPTAPAPAPVAVPAPVQAEPVEAQLMPTNVSTSPEQTDEPPPAPTLADVAQLTRASDYRRFVAPDVEASVRNAALKKLFASDPQFNVMDGLDTYIDDYGKPDPIPESMLRQMVQARVLGLFDDEEKAASEQRQTVAPAAGADPDGAATTLPSPSADLPSRPEAEPSNDDHAAVRLQPDDAAGPSGPADGAGPHAGRER
jgi:hypothetical protein